MPSIFSRKSKSTSRSQVRPPSGVPENFGHTRGGMTQLRRNEEAVAVPQGSIASPPFAQGSPFAQGPQFGQSPAFAQGPPPPAMHKETTYRPAATSVTSADRYAPVQQGRNGDLSQSASLPDARTQAAEGRPQSNGDGTRTSRSSSFWSRRGLNGSVPFPCRGFSAALHDQVVYWFGGKTDGGLHNGMDTLDTSTWEVRRVRVSGSVPDPREGHTATFIGRTMFVFGGEVIGGGCDDSLYAYNMANMTWYRVPMQGEALSGRKGHTTVPVGSKMFVFGGTSDGRFRNDLVSFDVRAATKQGPRWNYDTVGGPVGARGSQGSLRREDLVTPAPRAGHSCSVYPGSLYVFGGMDGSQCFNDLWVYDLELRRWAQVTPNGAMPPARYGHASAVVDDCIFVMGGRTLHGEPLNDFFAYKISSQRWYTFQVSSAAWPHQVDPVFSLVKTRLLLYSGAMPRDDAAPAVYTLETSKIKIQPDGARGTDVSRETAPVPSPVDAVARTTSMVDESRPPPIDTAPAASVDSFEMVSPLDDPSARAWSPQQPASRGRTHQRRSIALGQTLASSPPVADSMPSEPLPEVPRNEDRDERDDRRLTIQLRNRSSAGVEAAAEAKRTEATASKTRASDENMLEPASKPMNSVEMLPDPKTAAEPNPPADSVANPPAAKTESISDSVSESISKPRPESELHKEASRVWRALEERHAQHSAETTEADAGAEVGKASEANAHALPLLLAMRRELAEAKQQLTTVSRVAIERVAEAERGRKAALQEAIYLKAKASALASERPPLMAKLSAHRIHELERLYASALNDADALRSQLATATQSLRQSHDAASEARAAAASARDQLHALEAMQDDAGDSTRVAVLEQQLADRDSSIAALSEANAERSDRLEGALRSAQAAGERAERVQTMLEDALARSDKLGAEVASLTAERDTQRAETQRARDRATQLEQLWTGAKDEIATFANLRQAVGQLESKDRRIATLERKLSDAPPPPRLAARVSESSDSSVRDFRAAYLAAQRRCSESRDELLTLKAALRESEDARRDAHSRLDLRDRELVDLQARLHAFSTLLEEYANRKHSPLRAPASADGAKPRDRSAPADDDVSVAAMLAAIQQLQRSSSLTDPPPTAVDMSRAHGPTHIL